MSSSGRNPALGVESAIFEAEFERFEDAWRSGSPPDIEEFISDVSRSTQGGSDALLRQVLVEVVAIDLERRWRAMAPQSLSTVNDKNRAGELPPKPRLEDYVRKFPNLVSGGELPVDLIAHEYRVRMHWGDRPNTSDYEARFPAQATQLRGELGRIERELRGGANGKNHVSGPSEDVIPASDARTIALGESSSVDEEEPIPERIGRFEVTGLLGSGSFGMVYRAGDPQLKREVAIKVPRPGCVKALGGVSAYLKEARNIASLDHPGIVPVYEVGCTADGSCYVVSKLMTGGNLEQLVHHTHPSFQHAAELVARIADALHHAHGRGLVHRDIKPANILLDSEGNPLLADFGLAQHENEFGSGPAYVGTPTYMSPEQARVEGHMVDARTDIFSLGLVLFKLLCGKSPYRSKSRDQLVAEITGCEPRPARQLDPTVPEELDRICQKARATRPADRYSTAADLARDLRAFLRQGRKRAAPRWVLPVGVLAAVACAAVAFGLWKNEGPSGAGAAGPTAAAAALSAPYLDMEHVVLDENGRPHPEIVGQADIPLPEGAITLDVRLPHKQEGYLYLLQFDEGQPAKRLWPVDLARQEKKKDLQHRVDLSGSPRRIMFLAAVSPTRLEQSDFDAVENIAFSFKLDLPAGKKLVVFSYPTDPTRPRSPVRSGGAVRLSTNPQRELEKYFDSFEAIAFVLGGSEPQ